MKFTVLGSGGFIGRSMVQHLRDRGYAVEDPARNVSDLRGKSLGHVIYAIGLTGNFRTRTRETIDAHVYSLQRLMYEADFDSWLYLSSTRLYDMLPKDVIASEDDALPVRSGPDAVYNLSKLLGESVCFGLDNPSVRVARLANVYGSGMNQNNFLGSVIHSAVQDGHVTIEEAAQSAKDYVAIDDVVTGLEDIALHGRSRLYNVASGRSVSHKDIADAMQNLGFGVKFSPDGPVRRFPQIDTRRITQEFSRSFRSVIQDLPTLIEDIKLTLKISSKGL